MSGYCKPAKTAALFGDTNLAGGIPNRSRALLKEKLPRPIPQLSRETLPDPAQPPAKSQVRPSTVEKRGGTGLARHTGRPTAIHVPEVRLAPSTGPVYLEGRLVLSLSFRLERPTGNRVPVPEGEQLLERYRVWDDAAHDWLAGGPCVLRFESADVVMSTQPRPAIAWSGALDVRRPIIGVPDFDETGDAINEAHCLRWRKCTG